MSRPLRGSSRYWIKGKGLPFTSKGPFYRVDTFYEESLGGSGKLRVQVPRRTQPVQSCELVVRKLVLNQKSLQEGSSQRKCQRRKLDLLSTSLVRTKFYCHFGCSQLSGP